MDLEQIPQKKRNNCKEMINELIEEYIPKEKVLPLSSDSDALNLLRKISNEKKKVLQNRAKRSYMLVEGSEFQKETGKYELIGAFSFKKETNFYEF